MTDIAAITGVGGAQGAAIAKAFEEAGWRVRGLSRDGGEGRARADIEGGEGLDEALGAARALVFTLPQDHREGAQVRMARTVAAAARRAGVPRVVLNLAGTLDPSGTDPLSADMRAASEAFAEAGGEVVELMPTVYLDNLLAPWARAAMAEGALPYPAASEAPVAWLSHRSLGAFAVAAAERGTPGRRYAVGGPEALTGADLAARLGAAQGRPLAYAEMPGEAFEAAMNAAMGAPAGTRLRMIYERLRHEPRAMAPDPAAWAGLGVEPETVEGWAARQAW